MRDLKFRAWDTVKRSFIPENVYSLFNRTHTGAFGIMIKDWEDYKEGEYFFDGYQIISQSTDITDKTGENIHEGDVVTGFWIPDNSQNYIGQNHKELPVYGEIVWFNNGLCIKNLRKGKARNAWVHKQIRSVHDLMIIGNIYQTPELLSHEKAI